MTNLLLFADCAELEDHVSAQVAEQDQNMSPMSESPEHLVASNDSDYVPGEGSEGDQISETSTEDVEDGADQLQQEHSVEIVEELLSLH